MNHDSPRLLKLCAVLKCLNMNAASPEVLHISPQHYIWDRNFMLEEFTSLTSALILRLT